MAAQANSRKRTGFVDRSGAAVERLPIVPLGCIAMIYPARDLAMAICLTIAGCLAASWGYPALYAADPSPRAVVSMVVSMVGGVIGGIGLFVTLDFWSALRIQRQLLSGKAAIARWHITPAAMQLFVGAEARRHGPRPYWQPRPRDVSQGLDVAFGPEAVLVGGLGGLVLTAIAASLRRRQRGG